MELADGVHWATLKFPAYARNELGRQMKALSRFRACEYR